MITKAMDGSTNVAHDELTFTLLGVTAFRTNEGCVIDGEIVVPRRRILFTYGLLTKLVEIDIAAGKQDQIDHILIDTTTALSLWFERFFAIRTWINLQEHDGYATMRLGVLGTKYDIKIVPFVHRNYRMATIRADGNVV